MPQDLSNFKRGRENVQPGKSTRIALHYFPDTIHYRDFDLQTWLPHLIDLNISHLVLEANADRAIPESFITALIAQKIRPILRFKLSSEQLPSEADLRLLLEVYGRWGVREAIFFDRPNDRSTWPAASWAQQDLVERFIDRFVPLAASSIDAAITPIFPPLQPGGSYWDTAFLRSALQSLLRRKQDRIIHSMALSAYAWTNNRPLDWGAGGPETWPHSKPYLTPSDSQDQIGFRIFDWYLAVARETLRMKMPIYLLQAGHNPSANPSERSRTSDQDETIIKISRMLAGEDIYPGEGVKTSHQIPSEVVCGAFWLLTAPAGSPETRSAWFDPEGGQTPLVELFNAWRSRAKIAQMGANRIKHYLLLPAYEWGIDEIHLEVIRPFLRKYRPTVGFSTDEAVLADCVTVIGDEIAYPEEILSRLRQAGCRVERIQGDGTTIASLLAER